MLLCPGRICNSIPPGNNVPVRPIFAPNTQYQYSGGGSIVIRKILDDNGSLLLTARQPEKMYPIGPGTFFLASSPNDNSIFSSSKNNGVIDTFEVVQNGKAVIKVNEKF